MSVTAAASLSVSTGTAPLSVQFTETSAVVDVIVETGSAADTITETGAQANTYTEGA